MLTSPHLFISCIHPQTTSTGMVALPWWCLEEFITRQWRHLMEGKKGAKTTPTSSMNGTVAENTLDSILVTSVSRIWHQRGPCARDRAWHGSRTVWNCGEQVEHWIGEYMQDPYKQTCFKYGNIAQGLQMAKDGWHVQFIVHWCLDLERLQNLQEDEFSKTVLSALQSWQHSASIILDGSVCPDPSTRTPHVKP